LGSFGFCCFVGDAVSGVGSDILTKVIEPLAPNTRANFLTQVFSGN